MIASKFRVNRQITRRGFTLMELMIVVAIIFIILAIILAIVGVLSAVAAYSAIPLVNWLGMAQAAAQRATAFINGLRGQVEQQALPVPPIGHEVRAEGVQEVIHEVLVVRRVAQRAASQGRRGGAAARVRQRADTARRARERRRKGADSRKPQRERATADAPLQPLLAAVLRLRHRCGACGAAARSADRMGAAE